MAGTLELGVAALGRRPSLATFGRDEAARRKTEHEIAKNGTLVVRVFQTRL